jgi:uncharacterized protein (DUF486 family)
MPVVRTWVPILLLICSNVFMTFAWYGHLKAHRDSPLWLAILASWGIAFLEYCFMVPANRIGFGRYSLPQLKVIQEVVTLGVFALFALFYMRDRLTLNHLWAGCCLVGAVFFMFRK